MIVRNKNIIFRNIHGSRFLIDITENYSDNTCSIYEVNEIGEFIWKALSGEMSEEEIAIKLQTAVSESIEYSEILSDVRNFLELLIQQGFAERL